ncbi:MAG: AlpA family phage regulatory protein [Proteobacteria bacterium]|nr:AlpA family phage regulatory protein [Pseudomonadota bacterium]
MNDPTEDQIILAPELKERVPYSPMQIWRKERDGSFPKRIRLGANRVGWSLNEVLQWIEDRKAERFAA